MKVKTLTLNISQTAICPRTQEKPLKHNITHTHQKPIKKLQVSNLDLRLTASRGSNPGIQDPEPFYSPVYPGIGFP